MYISTMIYPGYITNDARRIHTTKTKGTMANASLHVTHSKRSSKESSLRSGIVSDTARCARQPSFFRLKSGMYLTAIAPRSRQKKAGGGGHTTPYIEQNFHRTAMIKNHLHAIPHNSIKSTCRNTVFINNNRTTDIRPKTKKRLRNKSEASRYFPNPDRKSLPLRPHRIR